ncbi:MAG TPA: RNA polymerase sigma factor SigJ [Gammaproteobacteria bacterium]
MDERTRIFADERARLFGLAYRMLSSKADAEDVLQDAYLRWRSSDTAEVRSPHAWLTTVVTRLSIDRLRHARVEREAYFGPWLPEPLSEADERSPEEAAELESDVSIAFLVMLEALSEQERAAFVLHDILDEDYADIAEVLGKSEAACRQMVRRARERITARRRRFVVDDETRIRMLERFIAAANSGNREAIMNVLAPDARMISDGGGKAVALIRPVQGAERISWLWFAVARRRGARNTTRRIVRVNGEPALALLLDGRLHSVSTIETDGERIHTYYTIANPDKLKSFVTLSALSSLA